MDCSIGSGGNAIASAVERLNEDSEDEFEKRVNHDQIEIQILEDALDQ